MQVMNFLSIHVSQAGESEGVNVEASRVKTWLASLQPTQQGVQPLDMVFRAHSAGSQASDAPIQIAAQWDLCQTDLRS